MGRIIPGEGEVAGREGPPVLPALAFLEIEENLGAPGPPGEPEEPGEPGAPGGTRTRGNHCTGFLGSRGEEAPRTSIRYSCLDFFKGLHVECCLLGLVF